MFVVEALFILTAALHNIQATEVSLIVSKFSHTYYDCGRFAILLCC